MKGDGGGEGGHKGGRLIDESTKIRRYIYLRLLEPIKLANRSSVHTG